MKKRILIAICVGLLVSMALVVAIAYGTNTTTSGSVQLQIENKMTGVDSIIAPTLTKNDNGSWNGIDDLHNITAYVENGDGSVTAYIRTVFAFEAGDLTLDQFHDMLCIKLNSETGESDIGWIWPGNSKWIEILIDDERYFMVTATYEGAVAGGEQTEESILGIGMDWNTDNADLQAAGFSDGFTIKTHSQAVESSGFDSAAEAFEDAYKEPTATNHPWNVAYVSTLEELMEALAEGRDVVLMDDINIDYGSITIN